jgi:hypothetical protein
MGTIDHIEVRSGGKLFRVDWIYDEELEEGAWVEEEITEKAPFYLFYPECELNDDVTLRDIFLLLKQDLPLYTVVIGNWVEEFVEEAFRPLPDDFEETEVEYLEVYWWLEYDKEYFSGLDFPSFHGIGGSEVWGDDINYSMSWTPVNEMLDLPLRQRTHLSLCDKTESFPGEVKEILGPSYTLGQIMYGIIWDISFYGGPESRDKTRCGVMEDVEDIKSGKAKGIPAEDVFPDLAA